MKDGALPASGSTSNAQAGIALEVEHLCKAFGSVRAVDDVSFGVGPGRFLTLLGPSGSGKTTILRLLGGFEYPDAGRIVLGGATVNRIPPYKRNIGVVFQRYALFPHMTVDDNVAFPLRRRGVGAAERARRVAETLALVGLEALGHRYPRQLSGGQQQRVALARAIVFHPEVLLMDEPLGALDKKLRERMQREIRALQQKVGITAVYVTHDQQEAMTMSDEIAVVHEGRIEQLGTPTELYERPETTFVAGFVGDSNLIEGEVVAGDGATARLRLPGGAQIDFPRRDGLGSRAVVLVRPEKMRLASSPPDDARLNRVQGRVRGATYVGDATLYEIALDEASVTARQENREGTSRWTAGDVVWVTWSPNDCAAVRPANGGPA